MPTLQQLQKAIVISQKIEALQAQLNGILGTNAGIPVKKRGPKPGSKRRGRPVKRAGLGMTMVSSEEAVTPMG